LRPIHEGEIRFVGDEIQFHGAARRLLERLARQFSRREGHTVSADQVAAGLIAGFQKPIGLHADLVRALDKMLWILKKIKEVKPHDD
jgi:hypothetical protein